MKKKILNLVCLVVLTVLSPLKAGDPLIPWDPKLSKDGMPYNVPPIIKAVVDLVAIDPSNLGYYFDDDDLTIGIFDGANDYTYTVLPIQNPHVQDLAKFLRLVYGYYDAGDLYGWQEGGSNDRLLRSPNPPDWFVKYRKNMDRIGADGLINLYAWDGVDPTMLKLLKIDPNELLNEFGKPEPKVGKINIGLRTRDGLPVMIDLDIKPMRWPAFPNLPKAVSVSGKTIIGAITDPGSVADIVVGDGAGDANLPSWKDLALQLDCYRNYVRMASASVADLMRRTGQQIAGGVATAVINGKKVLIIVRGGVVYLWDGAVMVGTNVGTPAGAAVAAPVVVVVATGGYLYLNHDNSVKYRDFYKKMYDDAVKLRGNRVDYLGRPMPIDAYFPPVISTDLDLTGSTNPYPLPKKSLFERIIDLLKYDYPPGAFPGQPGI